uniref:Potassium channel domain-containing protein n=1 Tax=viral metagenome TaxID=1070528 RepID=A0A6C0BA85_9ZZZZ
MKHIKKMLILNILMLIVFTTIYWYLSKKHFSNSIDTDNGIPTLLDYFNLSVTIQSTVGLPSMTSKTQLSKFFITLQQLLTIFSYFILLIWFYEKDR